MLISGTGWLLDFGVYSYLSIRVGFPVSYSNMLSAIPALTFVFFISVRKIFAESTKRIPLWYKYLIYFAYQMVLVFCVSLLGQWLFNVASNSSLIKFAFISEYLKILCKLVITPITILCNFVVMKTLSEKI